MPDPGPCRRLVDRWEREYLEENGPHWGDRLVWSSAQEIADRLDEAFRSKFKDGPRYQAGECDVFGDLDGAAVFDAACDGEPFCLIAADDCLTGKEGAVARAKDIAARFNWEDSDA